MRKVFTGLLALFVLLAAMAWGYREFALIPAMRAKVTAEMSDPASAQFRNDGYFGDWSTAGYYCGEVNAKNRMGGYTGYQWFSVFSGKSHIEPLSIRDVIDKSNPDRCDLTGETVSKWWWLRW